MTTAEEFARPALLQYRHSPMKILLVNSYALLTLLYRRSS
jgi:hypothetical protein